MIRRHGSLQRKYALIFGILVSGAVLTTSFAELYGAYDDHQAAVARLDKPKSGARLRASNSS